MKKLGMTLLGIAALGILISTSLFAEEVLYCTTKKGSGINYKNNIPDSYTLEGTPFSIKIHNNFESILVKESNAYSKFKCSETHFENYHVCNEFVDSKITGNSIRYNSQNNHFVRIFSTSSGYVTDLGFKLPDFILIGKCEKF